LGLPAVDWRIAGVRVPGAEIVRVKMETAQGHQ
jgi:hypothetical protein